MLRKKWNLALILSLLSLTLTLPASAMPVSPVDIVVSHFEAIMELFAEVFSGEESTTPAMAEGDDDDDVGTELGIIVDPYG